MRTRKYRFSKNLISSTQVFFDAPDLGQPGIHMVRVSREHWRPTFSVRSAGPPFVTIFQVLRGRGELICGEECYPLRPGAFFLTHPELQREIRNDPARPLGFLLVSFSGRAAIPLVEERLQRFDKVLRPRNANMVTRLFQLLFETALGGGRSCAQRCCDLIPALLSSISDGLLDTSDTRIVARTRFRDCRHYMDVHFQELSSISEVAEAMGISETYLQRLFSDFAGVSPYQYLLQKRMGYAAHLLQFTQASVADVAAELSYSDAFSFSKAFRRVMGSSPSLHKSRLPGVPRGRH
jgi:AraC-like DNA-binding protein